jgi:hypothetical protein
MIKNRKPIGAETRIEVSLAGGKKTYLTRTADGWDCDARPFPKPLHHLRDARIQFKRMNKVSK